jgi:hypothetical protein
MRKYDLHRQHRQQRTVGLVLTGLEKGGLFVLKKTVFSFFENDRLHVSRSVCYNLKWRATNVGRKIPNT